MAEERGERMIFISKKAFNEEMDRRMAEIHFKNQTDEKIWKMEEEIRKLKFKVECLEEKDKIPVPKVNYGSEACWPKIEETVNGL